MPKYKFELEVEISCPVDETRPELTITPTEIVDALVMGTCGGGYAVCVKDNQRKLTANMTVTKATMVQTVCAHCGSKLIV